MRKAGQEAVGQCFVLFTLSHGGRVRRSDTVLEDELEVIFGTDGCPVPKRAVVESLYNASCPNLRNIPRIVFFQSCRGGSVHFSLLNFLFVVWYDALYYC